MTLLLVCLLYRGWFPPIRQKVPICTDRSAVWHSSHPVQDICKVFEEVDAVEAAGTGKGVEDAPAFSAGMTAEEERVVPGEGDIAVCSLDEIVVP